MKKANKAFLKALNQSLCSHYFKKTRLGNHKCTRCEFLVKYPKCEECGGLPEKGNNPHCTC